jgi:transcriptional regulator with XRE-family HTH domain
MPRKADARTKSETAAFGRRLRKLRESRGWSQAGLAAKAGVSQPMVCDLEAARKQPGWGTVQLLAVALEVSTEEFRG